MSARKKKKVLRTAKKANTEREAKVVKYAVRRTEHGPTAQAFDSKGRLVNVINGAAGDTTDVVAAAARKAWPHAKEINIGRERRNAKPRKRRNAPSYQASHWGNPAMGGYQGTVPNPDENESLVELGELRRIVYRTAKAGTREDDWFHDFQKTRPVLAYGRQDGRLYIVGGTYEMTVHGIEG